jgi:hypothetical protein
MNPKPTAAAAMALFSLMVAVLLGGCALHLRYPDLGQLYDRAAQTHGPERNPIIVIPGILGTRLMEEGTERIVWGAFSGKTADPDDPEGLRLLAVPLRPQGPMPPASSRVYPAGVLDRVKMRFLGIPLEMSAYLQILATLGVGGFRDEELGIEGAIDYGDDHYTCFQFPYDWRLSNADNARMLDAFIQEKRRTVQAQLEERHGIHDAPVRFDVVAHSMGGLLLRYYLRYGPQPLPEDGAPPELNWSGSAFIDRAILVAPPNAGSLMAVERLRKGVRFAPFLDRYPAALLGSYASLYELLPRQRHGALLDTTGEPLDPLDPTLWEARQWGLADPEQDAVLEQLLPDVPEVAARRRIALDALRRHLRRARQFQAALDVPAVPPAGTELFLVAGDAVDTDAVARIDGGTGKVEIVQKAPGDGTVLRSSALMDERLRRGAPWQPELVSPIDWANAVFLFTNHLGLTKDPAFTDNVLYWLLEDPRRVRNPP